jgi:hypothetical protein
MSGGVISGNTGSYGGGVSVTSASSFAKTGGTIYGSDASASLKNTASIGDTNGHGVLYTAGSYPYIYYYRDTTLNAGNNISTSDPLPANSGETLGYWTKK